MRKPEYISPSALGIYEKDPQQYYLQYLADNRPPRFLQTSAMAAGSAFDAYIKSHLHDVIYGKGHKDAARYELKAIFEAQVETHNRDQAWAIGAYLLACYKESGALSDLMLEVQGAVDEPRFEFEIRGTIEGAREGVSAKKMGVPLLGKPDLRFVNKEGADVTYDWKVNGWYGNGNTSPMPGYVECREQAGAYWQRRGHHKGAVPMPQKGIWINMAGYLEDFNEDWAVQLATYTWLLGTPVGVESIIGIDQFACHGGKRDFEGRPSLRIVSHRTRVSAKFQQTAINRYINLWNIINEEPFYFFKDRSFEDSKAHCQVLDGMAATYTDPGLSDAERWTLDLGRQQRKW